MANFPPIDLLKATHSFPGPYIFKVIAQLEDTLIPRLLKAIREELDWTEDPKYSLRETAQGKHVAVTFELVMRTPEEVHQVYKRLLQEPGIILIL